MKKFYQFTPLFYVGLICLVIASLAGAAIPLFIRQGVDSPEALLDSSIIWVVGGLFLTQALVHVVGNFMLATFSENQIQSLRERLVAKIIYGQKINIDQYDSGDLSAHIMNDSNQLKTYLVKSLPMFVSGLLTILISFGILVMLDLQLTLVLFGALLLIVVAMIPIQILGSYFSEKIQNELGKVTGFVTETIRHLAVYKTNTAENKQMARAADSIKKIRDISLKSNLIGASVQPLTMMVIFGSITVIFLYGGARVASGNLTVGTLVSFLIYLFQLLNPFSSIAQFIGDRGELKGAIKPLEKILSMTDEDYESGVSLETVNSLMTQNVSFSYDDESPVLKHLSLDFSAHQLVAIVGPSGGGKSTLIHLLAGLYYPQEGHIKIGSQSLEATQLHQWREQFSLVSQDASIVSGTIRDNVLLGVEAPVNDEQIWSVLEQASLDQDIKRLEKGLDTAVGESGKFLSGGQAQRLQIARALLRDTPFIILDEATSNLDSQTETVISQTIQQLKTCKTIIVIAHRLSTITEADKIYFIEDGQLTGEGMHHELYETHALYRQYIDQQAIETT
ncbi:ABC transporter ATP-binding protein [Dolosigranulum savutiense]|uniref:ABC transporter ATP-binding protein n=1 Tax=Dolosigranulum savutiense TaxID=3110288 RepID=A0AB74TS76_9LACT